jgi:cytochrome c peroxidase
VKTPGLREAAWSAPYMLDGRAKTLDAAVAHAAATRGAGSLTATERRALVAFVQTLSSAQQPVAVAPSR